jgi:hypothetical protein
MGGALSSRNGAPAVRQGARPVPRALPPSKPEAEVQPEDEGVVLVEQEENDG